MSWTLHEGDCLDIMREMPDASVDAVITDPPYGCTQNAWDTSFDLGDYWREVWRIAKPSAAVVMFAQGMFTARLMFSAEKAWRYNLIWDKRRATGFLNAAKQPLRAHEDICVFYRSQPTYNAQMLPGKRSHPTGANHNQKPTSNYGDFSRHRAEVPSAGYPKSIVVTMPKSPTTIEHPTQKPTDLLGWLIRTYTNKGDTILDPFAGSGTTLLAAESLDRNSIGIELDPGYCDVIRRRMQTIQPSLL